MSWTAKFTVPSGKTPNQTRAYINLASPDGISHDAVEEQAALFMAAQDAVADVLVSGALGDLEEHEWSITMMAHSNPGNAAPDGRCPDMLTINIVQVLRPIVTFSTTPASQLIPRGIATEAEAPAGEGQV
jgi:hypothetical protein